MTLAECVEQGIDKVRKEIWAHKDAYVKIDIIGNKMGPWGHLYEQPTQDIIGVESPQTFLIIDDKDDDWIPLETEGG